MFRQVRFECGACGEGFVDWHDDDWERSSVYCVHCGSAIVARGAVEPMSLAAPLAADSQERSSRALGVLKGEGEGFRDTLPGLAEDEVTPAILHAGAPNRDTDEPTLPGRRRLRALSEATSTAPAAKVSSVWAARGRTLLPIGALLLGFAAGIPSALLAENPLLRLMNPAAYRNLQLSERLALVSSAIDDGHWERARDLLEQCRAVSPAGDSRVATLHARLSLGFILAHRPSDAGRELAAVPASSSVRPSAADLQRIYDVWFPSKPSAATTNSDVSRPAASAAPPKATVVVTKRELLSFARDRQRRVQLNEAERLYGEVLRLHPNDAEARCGLAEIQLLRGGTDDGAKLFERALADNASYLPAWVGLADVDWLRGHPERAACRYQAVIDRFPASSYPPYIAERVTQVKNSGVNLPQARTGVPVSNACDN
jgi:tetratricopeptide (TPR) repeat protein